MPCETAILKKVFTVTPDMNVDDALNYVREKQVRSMPVIDEEGHLLGMFSLESILKNLLPVAVTMEEGLQRLGFVMGAGPGVAKRLRKAKQQTVFEVMEQDVVVAHPTTALWEIVRLISKYGSPIPVVEEDNGTFIGIITEQCALNDLEKILEELEAEENAA